MNRFLEYTKALALNSFLQVLTFEERLQTSQYRAGRTNRVPARVQELQMWVEQHNWQPPVFKYDEDRHLLWLDEQREWQPVEKHPLYKVKGASRTGR
ncbi:hypothetical protein RCZ04_17100 [Capnocytophaga sp. HP1101]